MTDLGVTNYKRVLAALFVHIEMIKRVLNEAKNFGDVQFFRELKQMCDLGFEFYKIPEPIDNVCDLANEMIFTRDLAKILKDVYPDSCLEEIEMSWVHEFLGQMTLERAKVILSGKNIFSNEIFANDQTGHPKVEKWFKTKYVLVDKERAKI